MCEERKEFLECDDDGCLQKFDICIVDMGEINEDDERDHTLRKIRPAVILQSNTLNCEKTGTYIVAGITSAQKSITTKEDAEKFVEDKKKYGRIYVPIKRRGFSYFGFIEISQLRMLPANMIHRYLGRVSNPELKNRINRVMMESLFSNEELNIPERKEEVEEPKTETTVVEEKPKKKKKSRGTSFPMGFSKYYELYSRGQMTVCQLSTKINKGTSSTYYYIKKYEEMHPELVSKPEIY